MAEETVEPNEGIIGEVAASFKGVLIKDGSKDPRVVKHEDESFKVRSIIVVPMVFGGQLYGVLAVANPISGKPFTETDFSLAKSLGEQSGLAIHNSEAVSALIEKSKLEFDLKLASSVQRFLLPARLPQSSELECAVKYRPQKLIGGDFYDFIKLEDDRLGVVIGDVSGKGVSAAIDGSMPDHFAVYRPELFAAVGCIEGSKCRNGMRNAFGYVHYDDLCHYRYAQFHNNSCARRA